MAFVAHFSNAMDAGEVYDMLHDLLQVSDSVLELESTASPRLQVLNCQDNHLELDLAFADSLTPLEFDRISAAFCDEAQQLLRESGETKVSLRIR